ncbi:MAG: DUF4892 domain-containing protein [Oleiphilus sp.]
MLISRIKVWFILVLLVFSGHVASENVISDTLLMYNAQIEYQKQLSGEAHQIVLSTPKRINNELSIEKETRVDGLLHMVLSKLSAATSLNEAFRYYETLIHDAGSLLFQCQQRACGVSSYWANNVFDERRLSGRDSDHYYLAGSINISGQTYWISVYLVSNALRQNLVYVNYIKQAEADKDWPNGALLPANISDRWLQSLAANIKEQPDSVVYLALYSESGRHARLSEIEQEANAQFIKAKEALTQKLSIKPSKIQKHFVGPFHTQVGSADTKIWIRLFVHAP